MKKFNLLAALLFSFYYLEILFNVAFHYNPTYYFLIYTTALAICLFFIIKLLPKLFEKILFYFLLSVISIFFGVQLCVQGMYNFFFDFGLLAAADQVGAFYKDIITLIITNIFPIILILLPLIVCICLRKKLDFEPLKRWYISCLLVVLIVCSYVFLVKPENIATDVSIVKNGVLATFINDFKHVDEEDVISNVDILVEEPEPEIENKEPQYHVYDIDFANITEGNSTQKKLNEYFANESGTLENEYTGIFKDKNLILILGESYNEMAVSKELTPNLYKLSKEGFKFTNYYSTSYNSTLGGEFQLLNGMFAISGSLGIWKAGSNYFPMGIANMFKGADYSTFAYHNNRYDYMDRDNYLAAVGFDNYMGCWNGLEEGVNCNTWSESDLEMAEFTIDKFINEDKFFTYYVTVSGHGPYTFNTNNNDMGVKNRDFIYEKGFEYSDTVTAYLSGMVEMDKMIGVLLNKLEDADKLDDTVIVIVGDHYPYYLDREQILELSGVDKEEVVEVCENNLIIYNSATDPLTCKKAGNTMDVLATIYNLFGLDYDSRLIVGKDLLSEAPGFAIFGNGSWVSDYGIYYAHLNSFEPFENIEIPEGYFSSANSYVATQRALTNMIFSSNYYKYIWQYKDLDNTEIEEENIENSSSDSYQETKVVG